MKSNVIELEDTWREVADRYVFKDFIGKGGYGQVVKAIRITNGQTVAIKLVKNIFKGLGKSRAIVSEV